MITEEKRVYFQENWLMQRIKERANTNICETWVRARESEVDEAEEGVLGAAGAAGGIFV